MVTSADGDIARRNSTRNRVENSLEMMAIDRFEMDVQTAAYPLTDTTDTLSTM